MSKKINRKRYRISFGQRFFNFAYSIGAAIVIWGALFKILHLPGGNTLLSIGMGTEVLMFVLTAFDRPPREYKWEKAFPDLDKDDDTEKADDELMADATETEAAEDAGLEAADVEEAPAGPAVAGGIGGGTIIIGGTGGATYDPAAASAAAGSQPVIVGATSAAGLRADASTEVTAEMTSLADEMRRLHESTAALNAVSDTLLKSYKAITDNSEDITRTSAGYVEQLSDLNRNIQGLNTIYEIQLKSISSQLDSIDRVNRGIKDIRDMYEKSAEQSQRYCQETEKMARYMQQLNKVYEKMIHAMTVNPMMAAGMGASAANTNDED